MFMEPPKFGKMFDDSKESAFRLQLLDRYSVDYEREDFEAFARGQPFPNRSGHPWLGTIKTKTSAGQRWTNIHLLPKPLTPYLRYAIDWWYVYWFESGADVRFLFEDVAGAETRRLSGGKDFWLFDDRDLAWMHYDGDGRYLGAELRDSADDVNNAKRAKSRLIEASFDLPTLLKLRRSGEIA